MCPFSRHFRRAPGKPMFLDFYRLRVQPFGVSPDPRFLYLSASHGEALASLYCGIESNRGFLALIAPPGLGKTTLLHRLLEQVRDTSRTVFLFNTQCDSREFFRSLLLDLGIASPALDLVQMHAQINRVLLEEHRAGRCFLLVIDEAQNLHESVLETVRLLSNFETPTSKLLQIILSGQPQLAEVLARPTLSQLRQRVSILTRLQPFTPDETASYIEHRLRVAGYSGGRLFSPGALEIIAAHSRGIPRNINNLCFNALLIGCALKRTRIDGEVLREVIADVEVNSLLPSGPAAGLSPAPAPATAREPSVPAKTRIVIGRNLFRAAAAVTVLILVSLLATLWWTSDGGSLGFRTARADRRAQAAQEPVTVPSAGTTAASAPPGTSRVAQ